MTQCVVVALALEHLGVKTVAIPVTSPAPVAEIIRDLGGTVLWTKTEHHAMMASAANADLVAGARGEFIFSHFIPAYDGMFAAAKVLEGLARSGLRLRELADRQRRVFMREERVACPWGRKGTVMRRLMEHTEGSNRQLIDGVKVWVNEQEWALIIPHSDKPYFVITVEGRDEESSSALLDHYAGLVAIWRDES
jgi:mannose-1-phosphate guanylyltransferase/phosphomannomutase